MRILSADDIHAAVPMLQAIKIMSQAAVTIHNGSVQAPERLGIDAANNGRLLLMGATDDALGMVCKTVSVFPANRALGLPSIMGLVQYLDVATGEPLAIMPGGELTAWRTGALGGAAINLLARQHLETAVIIGCGAQAATQLQALLAVRQPRRIGLYDRNPEFVQAFIESNRLHVSSELVAVNDIEAAVAAADVVITTTNSSAPVFDGRFLRPGTHINAIGSFKPSMCELDNRTIASSRVFVDSASSVALEAGELIAALSAGVTRQQDWAELGEVVSGGDQGRLSDQDITLFKSVGHAVLDLYMAKAVFQAAEQQGLGKRIHI